MVSMFFWSFAPGIVLGCVSDKLVNRETLYALVAGPMLAWTAEVDEVNAVYATVGFRCEVVCVDLKM